MTEIIIVTVTVKVTVLDDYLLALYCNACYMYLYSYVH